MSIRLQNIVSKQMHREGFVTYSGDVIELSPTQRSVLFHLAFRFNDAKKAAWPKQTSIADELGVNVETVRRAVDLLEGHGLIRAIRVTGGRGQRMGTRYLFPWDVAVSEREI